MNWWSISCPPSRSEAVVFVIEREPQVILTPRRRGGPFRLQGQSPVPIKVQLLVKLDKHGAAKYKVPRTRPKGRLTLLAT